MEFSMPKKSTKKKTVRTITNEEREKLIQQLARDLQFRLEEEAKQRLINGNWGPITTSYNVPQPQIPPAQYWNQRTSTNNISPTDVDAKGKYPYQEPERDEQGTYYGYKVLIRRPDANLCDCPACQALVSPRYPQAGIWLNGELDADEEPREDTMHGIHFTKRPDHPELGRWYGEWHFTAVGLCRGEPAWLLVRCALSGKTLIETEQGFRVQHAQITEVMLDGYWQSYQNYSRYSCSNSRRVSYQKEDWRYTGRRDADTFRITHP